MNRPVVLVSMDWIRPGDPRTGLGTASIAAALRARNVDVTVIDSAVNRLGFDVEAVIAETHRVVDLCGPRPIVGVGAYVWNEAETQALLGSLRARDCDLAVGGPQVSYAPRGTLERLYPSADLFVRGYGENALGELATGREPNDITGVHVAGGPDAGRLASANLDALPSPHLDGTLPVQDFVRWETQRGCPFDCSFCQHPGPKGLRGRFPLDRVDTELRAFAAGGTQRIAVLDPIFHAKVGRSIEILRQAATAELQAHLSLQCRFELVTEAFLDALAPLNVTLEFGLQTIHPAEARAVDRPNDMKRVREVVDLLHTRGIPFEVSMIYGLPNQTVDSFRASLDWCASVGVPTVRAFPLMLLRGTRLARLRDRWGFVEESDGRIPIVVSSNSFSQSDHAEMAAMAKALDKGTRKVA